MGGGRGHPASLGQSSVRERTARAQVPRGGSSGCPPWAAVGGGGHSGVFPFDGGKVVGSRYPFSSGAWKQQATAQVDMGPPQAVVSAGWAQVCGRAVPRGPMRRRGPPLGFKALGWLCGPSGSSHLHICGLSEVPGCGDAPPRWVLSCRLAPLPGPAAASPGGLGAVAGGPGGASAHPVTGQHPVPVPEEADMNQQIRPKRQAKGHGRRKKSLFLAF